MAQEIFSYSNSHFCLLNIQYMCKSDVLPQNEYLPLAPISPYAASKSISEQYALSYNASFGTEFIGLRYFNVFGPRQNPSSPYSGVLSIFCNAIIERKPIIIYGDGEQTRNCIHVSDVVQANLKVAGSPFSNAVINVGCGQQTSLNSILSMLQQISMQSLKTSYQAGRIGDIRYSVADISSLQAIPFSPQMPLRDGLVDTLEWLRNNHEKI